ncbi:MAG TPA: tetratricopeptide repeat protein [Oculatellaceae cyanobacterium]
MFVPFEFLPDKSFDELVTKLQGPLLAITALTLISTGTSSIAQPSEGVSKNETQKNVAPEKASADAKSTSVSAEEVKEKLNLGRKQRNDAAYREAEETFKSALKMCPDGDNTLQAEVLESIAGLYLATNRLDESESLYGRAIRLLESGADQAKLAIAYDNMSNVCLKRHKIEEAQNFNQKCIDILANQVKSKPVVRIDLAKALNQKALLCVATRKLPEAEDVFKQTISLYPNPATIDEKLLVATALDNLGGVYLKQAKFADSEASRLKALVIYEKVGGGKSQDLAKCLQNVASVYGHQHQYEKALPFVKRAEFIEESTLGLKNPDTLSVLKDYILLLKLTHKDAEIKALSVRLAKQQPVNSKQ